MEDYVYSKDDVTNSSMDVWDDTELIKMYEDSVSATYKKLGEPSTTSKCSWSVGDRCMARYYEDGLYYPAEIIDVDDESGQFLVLFGGYENSEWVSPDELNRELSSDAQLCNNVSMESADNDSTKKRSTGKSIKRDDSRKRTNNSRSSEQSSRSATVRVPQLTGAATVQFRSPIIPSIAPPPPPALSGLTPPDEMEALSSMLMSWYMSGYHTGYYQALSDQKKAGK